MKRVAITALLASLILPLPALAAPAVISAARMDALDKVLASDAFQGRAPGTPWSSRRR